MPTAILRDVVESDGQDQKGGPAAQMAEGFRGELGEQGVHGQQEGDAQDGPPSGRDPSHHAHGLRLLDGGDQEAPHAGGDHHAGGEPQEDPVDRGVRAAPEEKYGGRPQGGEQSGEPLLPPAAHNSACANVCSFPGAGSRAAVIGGERTDGPPLHYAGGGVPVLLQGK